MRPFDLAREHGISTQAVRNYERDGLIPPAERTPTGYRVYTETHAAALRAYLALVPAHGYAASGQIMRALNDRELDAALTAIDRGHAQLLRDRGTLDTVRRAVEHLTSESPHGSDAPSTSAALPTGDLSVGEVARHLGVTPATLRTWEGAGILAPGRNPATGHRSYRTDDVRDAELAHLLRRGGYLLNQIATVIQQLRGAGGTEALSAALDDWQQRLTRQGAAMLDSAAQLAHYLPLLGLAPPDQPG